MAEYVGMSVSTDGGVEKKRRKGEGNEDTYKVRALNLLSQVKLVYISLIAEHFSLNNMQFGDIIIVIKCDFEI